MSRFDNWADKNNGYSLEGSAGLKNLCRYVRTLGYKDDFNQLQLSSDACVGDLLLFLEDNPGAIEAMLDWVDDNADIYPDPNGDNDEDEDGCDR